MVRPHAAAGPAITENGLPHAAAKATKAAAPEATEAATAAPRRIADHREEAMAAFEKSWRNELLRISARLAVTRRFAPEHLTE